MGRNRVIGSGCSMTGSPSEGSCIRMERSSPRGAGGPSISAASVKRECVEPGVDLDAVDHDAEPIGPAAGAALDGVGEGDAARLAVVAELRLQDHVVPAHAPGGLHPDDEAAWPRPRTRGARRPDLSVTFSSWAGPPGSAEAAHGSTLWPLAFQSTSGPSMSACSADERASSSSGSGYASRLPSRGDTRQPAVPSRT